MKAFVTGTDTGVGKTYATALLTRALRKAGLDTIALKPICCGDRSDVVELAEAADGELSHDEINPLWLQAPVAPLVALGMEQREFSMAAVKEWFGAVTVGRQSVLVEGAGGWLVPIADRVSIADLASALGLPVIVVVANRLGCLNHTLLTLESIRSRSLTCSGIILNTMQTVPDEATRTNKAVLEKLAGVPIILEVTAGQREIVLAVA